MLVGLAISFKLNARIHAVRITLYRRVPCSQTAARFNGGLRILNLTLCAVTNCHQQLVRHVPERADPIAPITRAGTLLTLLLLAAKYSFA